MSALGSRDFESLLAGVRELNAPCTLEEFPRRAIAVLSALVASEHTAYNEVNTRSGRIIGLSEPGSPPVSTMAALLAPHLSQHPLIARFERDGDGSPAAISDFYTPRAWHKTALFNEFFRVLDLEDQMSVGLAHERDFVLAVTLNRGSRSFGARDRELLALLRPHLRQAYENAVAAPRWQRELAQHGALWEGMEAGVALVSGAGALRFCTRKARSLLCAYFGSDSAVTPRVRDWLRAHRAAPQQAARLQAAPLRIEGANGTLTLREDGQTPEGTLLLLDETRAASALPLPGALRALGLTPRQGEVLWWLVQGETNAQIAARLGLSLHTTKRHLEAIYERLGVESRAAAAHRARQALHSSPAA